MLKANTALRLYEIVKRVCDTELEHDEDSIYWPEERAEWKRVLRRAKMEMKNEKL